MLERLGAGRATAGRRLPRRRMALAGIVALGCVGGGVAIADQIVNTLDDSVDAVAEVMALNQGGPNGATTLYLVTTKDDGKPGCNITGSTTLTLAVSSSTSAVATVSPSTVTFASCGETKALTVTPHTAGSTTISLSQTGNTTGGSFDLAPATFAVNVAPPANSAPGISIAGVTPGASYPKGSEPAPTCEVTDAEDGTRSFPATLGAITGPYASDGIGTQEASCSYTDAGGLTASASVTYSIVDDSKPTVDYTLTPPTPDGANGWYVGNVLLDWTIGDAQSPNSLVPTGCDDTNVTADQPATTYSCTATSAGGSTGPVTVTIKRDATKPLITREAGADSCSAPGTNGWCRGTQTAGFRASDATSGLANGEASPWSFTTSTTTNGDDVHLSSGTVDDVAGNTADAIDAGPYKIDSVKPTISGAASPPPNGEGWNNTDVDVDFTCDDSGSGVASCGPDATLTDEGRAQSVDGTAVDEAGNSATTTVGGIDVDTTAPSAPTATTNPASAAPGSGGWFKDTATVSFGGSNDPDLADGSAGSGVASYSPAQTFATSGTHGYAGSATDRADNESTAAAGVVNVDATAPTVGISGCPTGQVTLGSTPSITVTAQDAHAGLVSDPSGAQALDTTTVGSKTVTVSVADKVGHTAEATCAYSVIYPWTGFFQPIDNGGVFNQVNAGRTIPVKFSLGGDRGLLILDPGSPSSAQVSCPAGAPVDSVEETTTATSGLKYDPIANQYIYNWKTTSSWASTCRRLTVDLVDGTTHTALFKFVK